MQPSLPDEYTMTDTLRVLIVDDEPLARSSMRLVLDTAADVTVVAECGDGVEAVKAIRESKPDIVFLDVQMPGLDGFGVIDEIGADMMPNVVFVTAYDAHAIRAFEVHALDYVLKPFGDERFLAALDRARAAVHDRQLGQLGRRLAAVVGEWQRRVDVDAGDAAARAADGDLPARPGPASYIRRFTVRGNGRARFVPVEDVDWIGADGNYMILHVGSVHHRVRGTLRDVLNELDPRRFARIHRSTIVNIDRISEMQPWFGGDYIAILRTGAKLKVSRLHAAKLLRPRT